jgi:hypothetical protein
MPAMNDNTFKKAPARKKPKGKRVSISDEAKKAYEEMMQKRDAEEKLYRTHLDAAVKRV